MQVFFTVLLSIQATAAPDAASTSRTTSDRLVRAYVVGHVGDHDGDGVEDYAIAGSRIAERSRRIVVRIRSGTTDALLAAFDTPVKPLCAMVVHSDHVARVADLNGDGAFELGAWDGGAWLLDGRTGALLREFGPGATVLGSCGDVDRDGVPDVVVDEPPSRIERIHRDDPKDVRLRSGVDFHLLDAAPRGTALDALRLEAAIYPWVECLGSAESAVRCQLHLEACTEPGDDRAEHVSLELRDLAADVPAWREDLGLCLADDEHGGLRSFRVASPGDLDGDGEDDIAVAVPATTFRHGSSFCAVVSRTSGVTLWRSPAVTSESLNLGVDRLRDRDGDGFGELVVSIAGDGEPSEVVVLSGRTGTVLRRLEP
jgi:hypothetical protein